MSKPKIPIQNIYYLLCYAWDRLEQGQIAAVSARECTDLVDLFAVVLIHGVQHLARRGLNKGYLSCEEEIRGVRGRLDPYTTERRFLSKHGRASCTFDELSADTLPNQIIKSTLMELTRVPELNAGCRSEILRCLRELKVISEIKLRSQIFRRVQLNGNSAFYRFLLNVCEMIHDCTLPDEDSGALLFRDFIRDERRMAYLFQYFVFNFLRIECPNVSVFRENLQWAAESPSALAIALLPQMQTDISLIVGSRKIIIDTKYYTETLSQFYGAQSFHSDNLYQLVSYMKNAAYHWEKVEGILLYPRVNQDLDEKLKILGMPLRIKTLDLTSPWQQIHAELLSLPL